ncbi:MAG: hypothetical protein ACPG77_00055 [Nannocystaceae bacterium]
MPTPSVLYDPDEGDPVVLEADLRYIHLDGTVRCENCMHKPAPEVCRRKVDSVRR